MKNLLSWMCWMDVQLSSTVLLEPESPMELTAHLPSRPLKAWKPASLLGMTSKDSNLWTISISEYTNTDIFSIVVIIIRNKYTGNFSSGALWLELVISQRLSYPNNITVFPIYIIFLHPVFWTPVIQKPLQNHLFIFLPVCPFAHPSVWDFPQELVISFSDILNNGR